MISSTQPVHTNSSTQTLHDKLIYTTSTWQTRVGDLYITNSSTYHLHDKLIYTSSTCKLIYTTWKDKLMYTTCTWQTHLDTIHRNDFYMTKSSTQPLHDDSSTRTSTWQTQLHNLDMSVYNLDSILIHNLYMLNSLHNIYMTNSLHNLYMTNSVTQPRTWQT